MVHWLFFPRQFEKKKIERPNGALGVERPDGRMGDFFHGHTDTRSNGHTDAWAHGRMDSRTHGHTVKWTHGRLGVWTYRPADARSVNVVHMRPHRHMDPVSQLRMRKDEDFSRLRGQDVTEEGKDKLS